MGELKIEEGDVVWVTQMGEMLCEEARVDWVPCATGDSWHFYNLITGQVIYVSDGCTVGLINKREGESE